MDNPHDPKCLSDDELVVALHSLCDRSVEVTATLLEHLAEVDERKLYLEYSCSCLHRFCVKELHLSDSEAHNRIHVARAAVRFPRMLEYLRHRQIHLSGLRLLAPHLTVEGHEALLAEASGKSKSEIEEIIARHAPRPAVADSIREVPNREPQGAFDLVGQTPAAVPPAQRPVVGSEPLSGELFRFEFTAGREFRDMLQEAQDLMSHRHPRGDLAVVLGEGLTLLVCDLKKKRFGVGRKERKGGNKSEREAHKTSRRIPDAIKRAVWERDKGRCAFVDARGQRCSETAMLQLDHVDGFARDLVHSVDRIRLACAAHNQLAADKMYGKSFMQKKRAAAAERRRAQAPAATSTDTQQPQVTHDEREPGEIEPEALGRADGGARQIDVRLRHADKTPGSPASDARWGGAALDDPGKSSAGEKTPDAKGVELHRMAHGALRKLGFRETETKHALAEVWSQLGPGASLEQILRLALRVLGDGPMAPSRRPSAEPMCAP